MKYSLAEIVRFHDSADDLAARRAVAHALQEVALGAFVGRVLDEDGEGAQPKEIVLTGDIDDFRRVLGQTFVPHRVLVAGSGSSDLPLMQHRPADKTLAYVCIGYACEEPTSDPGRLRELLAIG